MPDGTCYGPRCNRAVYARGLCKPHYTQARLGKELKPLRLVVPPEERFWAKVNKDGPLIPGHPELGPCWLWTKSLSRGYGYFSKVPAHRVSYEWLVGPIAEGLETDHLCHTLTPECIASDDCPHRSCVNPHHLEVVTHRVNADRGRNAYARRERCLHGHPFDEGNAVRVASHSGRVCRVCRIEAGRRYRAKIRALRSLDS